MRCLSDTDKQRIAALERLDEMEEFNLLLEHYVLVWALRDELGQIRKRKACLHWWSRPDASSGRKTVDRDADGRSLICL